MAASPDVTIVLTCLDEGDLVLESIDVLRRTLRETRWTPVFVIVDDGSTEETKRLLRERAGQDDGILLLEHGCNRGRGRALSTGLAAGVPAPTRGASQAAAGRFAGYIDPDLEIEAAAVPALLACLEDGADVAVARRSVTFHASRIPRAVLTRGYALLARAALRPPVSDTEAGCKFFRREALARLLPKIRSEGWFWDTEIVVRAHRMGLRVREAPARYAPRPGRRSTVRVAPAVAEYLKGLWSLRAIGER